MDSIQYENCLDAIRELLERNRSKTKMLLPEAFDRLMHDAAEMEATIGVLIADNERSASTIARLTAENERVTRERDGLRRGYEEATTLRNKDNAAAQRMGHVIIECGAVPGVNGCCRCDDCKQVAKDMADAGFLEDIKGDDRWWGAALAARENKTGGE